MIKKRVVYGIVVTVILCSCATYRQKTMRFPITVTQGGADVGALLLPVQRIAEDESYYKSLAVKRQKESEARNRREGVHGELLRPSPSENDYQSTIRMPPPASGSEMTYIGSGKAFAPYQLTKYALTAGEKLSLQVPRNYRIQVTVTNMQEEPLEFQCSGHLFRLMQHESKTLEFR
nr:hypothetical protein [uncultured Treponema sp.]